MKTKITFPSKRTLLLSLLTLLPSALLAQGTAFTYQGSLNDGVNRANGIYDVQFAVYNAGTGPSLVAGPVTNSATTVSNGLFTATLDFGPGVFTGPPRWIEISVRSNGIVPFVTLTPRQLLTATPYAITASNLTGTLPASQLSGAIPSGQLSGSYNTAVNFNNAADQFNGHFLGDGSALSGVNASLLGGLAPTNFWQTGGNSNILAGLNYLGTADSNVFELRVNNDRGLRVEPDPRGLHAPNLIGGYGGNSILQPYSGGNTIAGGGVGGGPNLILTNSAGDFIGAGSANIIGENVFDSVIAGGYGNSNLTSDSVIAGGTANLILPNGQGNFISAGSANVIASNSFDSVIGGGYGNSNLTSYAVIAGGVFNEASGYGSVVGGGGYNGVSVMANRADADASTIAGGLGNTIAPAAAQSSIGGGFQNIIQSNNLASTIAGGENNFIGVNSFFSVIAGGAFNLIQSNSAESVITGGIHNTNWAQESIIGGGQNNLINLSSIQSIIASGAGNVIGTNAYESTISGGALNNISNNSQNATIGGGYGNAAGSFYATVPGGYLNVALGAYSFAAGSQAKANSFGTFVWADAAGTEFASTGPNQFLIRAGNGVGIGKNNPATALDVAGTVTATAFNSTGSGYSGSGAGLTGLSASQLTTGTLPSAALSGIYANALTFNNAANSFSGSGFGLNNVNAALLNGQTGASFWGTTGNSGTIPGLNYIGTSDNKNLLIRGAFVGVGRTNAITGADYFSVECPSASFGGMYLNTAAGGWPFYGYSQGGLPVAYHFIDGFDANKWKLVLGSGTRLTVTTAGFVGIGNIAPTNLLMVSNARCDGSTWINASDRALKENFAPIDPQQILTKVAALPLNQWNYKSDTAHPHLGPVAQDFYAQFSLGADDKSIATVDESGVALAAIQGLNSKVEAQAAQLREKDTRIAALEKAVAELRTLVTQTSVHSP